MKVMKKNLFLSLLLLCSMMFFASCTKSDDPGSNNNSDNNSDAIAKMQIATTTDDSSQGMYIYRKGNIAYLRISSDSYETYSYASVGKVAGLKDMERFIFDMPALTKVGKYDAINIPISEGDGYIHYSNYGEYYCWYIYKINCDASGDVVNVFYYRKAFTPYVGWDD